MKKAFLASVGCLTLAFLLAGCSGSSDEGGTVPGGKAPAPAGKQPDAAPAGGAGAATAGGGGETQVDPSAAPSKGGG